MPSLRTIRITVASIFLSASVAYLFFETGSVPAVQISERVQIIPSALAVSIGATAFWLVATFFFGRIYCSLVCPVGIIQDSATWLRRRLYRIPMLRKWRNPLDGRPMFAPFRYRKSGKWRGLILLFYVVCLLLGFTGIAALFEPWNIMRLASESVHPAPTTTPTRGLLFASNLLLGAVIGFEILIIIWIWALVAGRKFCTEVCPIGTVLGHVTERGIWQIEFDPDRCVGCLRCEEICKSECIKVVSRYVNNSKCVRCFDCIRVCDDDAIRFTPSRHRPATPLLRRKAGT